MTQRLGGLHDVDPEAAPLPVGTEVITRVDRLVEHVTHDHAGSLADHAVQAVATSARNPDAAPLLSKPRSQGAVGKVIACDLANDTFTVRFVDGKQGTFNRAELLPRKVGLLRYQQRRDNAWHELSPTVVLTALVGSTAWGLADATSDQDHRGVFVLPLPWQTGLVEPPQDLLSEDRTSAHWEVGKAVRQGLRADPNTLEMLFATPTVIDPMGALLIDVRTAMISREIYGAFGRYALAQLDRLQHNQRLAAHRDTTLQWLRAEPGLSIDAAATRLVDAAQIAAPTRRDAIARARDYLKQLYRSLYDQDLLASNEWQALAQFASADPRAFELPRDLRPKNAYNLLRLLDQGIRWLGGEPPTVRVPDELQPTLRAIKRGDLPMTEVMALAQAMTPRLEAARDASPLPMYGDVAAVERALRAIRHESARRFIEQSPDAWGMLASAPPPASYQEK